MRLHSQEWVSFILRWVCFFEKNCEKQAFLYLELRRGWEGTITVSKISLWFCSVYGKMSLNTFAAKFNDYFGFKIPNYKFAEKLKSANVWDNIVTDSMDEYMDSLIDFSEMSDDDLFSEEFI